VLGCNILKFGEGPNFGGIYHHCYQGWRIRQERNKQKQASLAWFIQPRIWGRYVRPKRRVPSSLHSGTIQKS
jgi:hypothetical protein